MATGCTEEAVLQFLTERGGRVKNLELIDYFKSIFPSNPDKRTAVRETFKEYVDNIAFVKIENGVKFVCLKKKYRGSVKFVEKDSHNGTHGVMSLSEQKKTSLRNESYRLNVDIAEGSVNDATSVLTCGKVRSVETPVKDTAQHELLPGSGYGTDNSGEKHPYVPEIFVQNQSGEGVVQTRSVGKTVEGSAFDMGNKIIKEDKKASANVVDVRMLPPEIPQISVIEASPLPAPSDGSMFTMPGLSKEAALGQAGKWGGYSTRLLETHPKQDESLCITQGGKDANVGRTEIVARRRNSREYQCNLMSNHPSEDGKEEAQMDSSSLSGSESHTPKGSRKNFIELMIHSSPHVRRSMALRNSVYLSTRHSDCSRSDSDSVTSLVSSTTEDDATPVTLDPLEHEWMMCSSDGHWGSLHELLTCEPNLILKKDFVTGFTCLHWAAKQGKPELLALIVNFAKKHTVPININTKSSAGYTPLHLAAMHNHIEVVKLLIGAYDADVEARDYSGKKACQYLPDSVAVEMREIIGACGDSESGKKDHMDGIRWRLSKVLHSSLMPLKLLNHSEDDSGEGPGQAKPKLLRRKSSLSSIRPKLQKIRFRSQIVHSMSFHEGMELEGSLRGSVKSRPKTTVFG